MELARDIVAAIFILGGCFFTVVAAIGLVRLPDVYARVHSAGIADTVGVALFFVGLSLHAGFTLVTVKLMLILAFLFFTSPTSTNALANAVYSKGIDPVTDDEEKESSKP